MTMMESVPHAIPNPPMTACELQDLLVAKLVHSAGGSMRRWRIALGPVRLHACETAPPCNWSVTPAGGGRENAEIARLLENARLTYPFVVAG